MTAAAEIVASVRISDVFQALTGAKPIRTGTHTSRVEAAHRGGTNRNLSMDDQLGVWHDFAVDEGGGVLDLVVRVRGGNKQDALHWLADYAGFPIGTKSWSRDDKERWAREKQALDRYLPDARLWLRSAIALAEENLHLLKTALFDSTQPQPQVSDIQLLTRQIVRWQHMDGAALVAEYKEWRTKEPMLVAGMIRVAELRVSAERRAILRYLESVA